MDAFYNFKKGIAPSTILNRLEEIMAGVDKGRIKMEMDTVSVANAQPGLPAPYPGLSVKRVEALDVSRRTVILIEKELSRFGFDVAYRNIDNPLETRESFIEYLDDKIFAWNLKSEQSEEMRALIKVVEAIKADLVTGGESMDSHFGRPFYFPGFIAYEFDNFVKAVDRFSEGTGDISSRPMMELGQLVTQINSGINNYRQLKINLPPEADFGTVMAEAGPLLERYRGEDFNSRMPANLDYGLS